MLHEKTSKKDDYYNLHDIRWLKAKTAKVNPTLCTVYLCSEETYCDQKHQTANIVDPVKIADPQIIHQRHHDHKNNSDAHTDHLFHLIIAIRTADHHDTDY